MLDKEIVKLFQERIKIEITEQNARLKDDIVKVREDLSARGLLHSGLTVGRVTELCKQAIKDRAQLVWQIVFRFITTAGVTYSSDLAEELNGFVAYYLPENLDDFRGHVDQVAQLLHLPTTITTSEGELSVARQQTLRKMGTEIDLFVHSLKKRIVIAKDKSDSLVFNIYSPVGSIQTGSNSAANVQQDIDVDLRSRLSITLEEIKKGLEQLQELPPYPKSEIIQLANEGYDELKKEKPNVAKLRAMLTAIGSFIQTIADLKPAYSTLRQLLTYFGVSLP